MGKINHVHDAPDQTQPGGDDGIEKAVEESVQSDLEEGSHNLHLPAIVTRRV
jgi:hypothetical protein